MRIDALLGPAAWVSFATVCALPFLAGGVYRSVWIPLCQFWLGLGIAIAFVRARSGPTDRLDASVVVSRALFPLHALFLIQLIPLPRPVLQLLSPGAFAVHFLPDPGPWAFRPLSVSPAATVEAWLYVAGLQGLFLALSGFPARRRPTILYLLLGVAVILAAEGLWQSRTTHPYHFYGVFPVEVESGFQTSVFGPYFNRNHFATITSMGVGLAAGLAASMVMKGHGLVHLLRQPAALAGVVTLGGLAGFLALTTAASGSRSGTLAALVALAILSYRAFGKRIVLVTVAMATVAVAVSGSAVFYRLMQADVLASRWVPWLDMARLVGFFPVFGSGIGTFGSAYWPYQTNATYEYWPHAHNDYLQWLIETGLLGCIAVVVMLRRLRATVQLLPWGREAILGVTAAFGTQAFLDLPLHIPASVAVLVCVIAVAATRRTDIRA